MDKHRGIDLENDDPAFAVQGAVDAEIIEAEFALDGAQGPEGLGIEDRLRDAAGNRSSSACIHAWFAMSVDA